MYLYLSHGDLNQLKADKMDKEKLAQMVSKHKLH